MNEEVINDLYNNALSKGYRGSREAFISVLHSNDAVMNDMFSYVKSNGYRGQIDNFKNLVGATSPVVDSPMAVEPKKKEDTTALPSGVGSSASSVSTPDNEAKRFAELVKKQGEVVGKRRDEPGYIDPRKKLGMYPTKEQADRATAQAMADINVTTGERKEPEKKGGKSYLENIALNLGLGTAYANEAVLSIPESVVNLLAIPQNYIAEKTGLPIGVTAEGIKESWGITNPLLDYAKEGQKVLGGEVSNFMAERYEDPSIKGNFEKGNYREGFELLGSAITQSLPTSVGLMIGGAYTAPSKLATIATLGFTEDQREELAAMDPTMSEAEKTLKAAGMAAMESVFSSIGTGTLGKVYKDIAKREGTDAAKNIFRDGLIIAYETALKKGGLPVAVVGNSLEEGAVRLSQNIIAGRPIMDGVADAFITGGGSGVVFGAPISAVNAKRYIENKITSYDTKSKVTEILKDKADNMAQVYNVPVSSEINATQLDIANLPNSRDLLVNNLKKSVSNGQITDADAKQSLFVFDKVQQVSNAVKDLNVSQGDKARIATLLRQRDDLRTKIQNKDDVLVVQEKRQIEDINNQIQEILSAPKQEAASYKVDGKDVTVEAIDELIKTKSKEELLAMNIEVNNDQSGVAERLQAAIETKPIQQDAIQEQAAGEVPVQPGTGVSQEVAQGESQAEPQGVTEEGQVQEVIPASIQPEIDTIEAQRKQELEENRRGLDKPYYLGETDGPTLGEVINQKYDAQIEELKAKAVPQEVQVQEEVVTPEVITEESSLMDTDFDEEGDLTDEGFTKAENYLKSIIEEEANNAGVPVDILLKHYNINNKGEYFSSTTPILRVSESNNYQRVIKTLKDISFKMFPDKIDQLNEQINNYSQDLLDSYERGDKGTVIDKSHGKLISALDNINDKFNQFVNPQVQEEVDFNEEEVNLLSNLLDKSEAEGKNLPEVFQLETTTDNEARKQSLVESATKLMETVSDDLSSKSSQTNAPTMEPTPIVITENTELTNKVPRFPLVDLIKKRINLVMADQLKVGDGFMGGPLFPLIDGIFGKAAWASINLDAAKKIARGAINGDYSVVFNMNPTAVDSNTAFMDTFIKKLNDTGIKENVLVELKSYVKDKKFGKKTDQIRKITEESTTIDEFSERLSELDVDTISDFVKKIIPSKSVVAETAIGKILQSQNITQEDIRDEISEQLAKDLPMGAMTMVLKITDANGNPVTEKNIDDAIITPEQQKAEGIPSHRNYPFYVRGTAVGILDSTVPFWNMSKAAMSTINAKVAKVIRNSEGKAYSASQARAAAMRSASMKASKSFVTQPPTKSAYQQFIERLSKAIPSVEVVTSQKEFDDLLANLNAKSLATKNQKIYGAVLDGKLYLNPSLENFNTPIHEFAHVWTNTIKELSPEIYQKGIDLIQGSDYVSQIEASKDYKRITDKMRKDGATDQEIRNYILEEALATAVGDKGESFATASQKRNFKNWLNDLFQFIKKLTGISKLTPEQIQNLSLDDFLNSVVVDLLSEKPIFKNAEVRNLNNQLQLMARPDLKADDIVKIGLANGFSEGSIRELLKRRGFNQEEINRAVASTVQAAKKVEVTEEFAPGYDRVLNEITGVVEKSRNRGRSETEIMQNAIDYLQGTKVYENATDVQREAMVRNVRKEFKKREKAAPSAEKVVGKPKKKEVTVDEMAALKDQIKLEARAAREAKGDLNTKRKALAAAINKLADDGKITAKKAETIAKRALTINIDSEVAVNKFIDYVSKVFADADYASKLSNGNAIRKKIRKVSRNKDKSANLRDLGVKFSEIDPSMVEDIDQYNEIADKILKSIEGSSLRSGVKFADIVKIADVSDYINTTIEKQRKEILKGKIDEMSELLGIEITEEEYFKIIESINNNDPLPKKYKDGAIRKAIDRAFNVYSAIIDDIFKTRKDPVTGEEVSISDKKKKVVKDFMSMDLNLLSDKEALASIDSLLNFIQNGSTAKMSAIYNRNLGEQNAIKLDKKGFKSFKLKKYFSPGLAKVLVEQFTQLDLVIERMFKGFNKAGDFMFEAGISAIKKGKSLAQSLNNKIVDNYFNTFYKSKPNGQEFNTIFNTVERGMTAYMMRTMPGTEVEINTEFKKKKSLIEQSIDNLKKGDDKQKELADVYTEVYNKLVKGSENYDDVVGKADPKNVEAVRFWQNEWANKYEDLSDLSESIYNKTLGSDLNYTPVRVSNTGQGPAIDENSDEMNRYAMSFHTNNQTTYQRETGVLMTPTLDDKLSKGAFIDLSFDRNNANSMYDALIDLNTADAVRQIAGFFNSDSFENIIQNADDRKILKGRVNLFIRNIRNKNPYDNDEFAKAIRGLQNLAALGAGRALAGPTQAVKQTVPVIMNTVINAGRIDLTVGFNKDKNDFINNSGYSIANRSAASNNQIESINKLAEKAANSLPSKIADSLLQLNELQLKIFLQKPDAYVARASWMSYYEKSLRQQGIDTKSIDYATHQINDKAADYAQRMVDRQQNLSDMDLAGKFVGSKNPIAQFVNKTIMPFSSFRINQSARLGSDWAALTSKVTTDEDRVVAARSLGGFFVELATFRAVSATIAVVLASVASLISGREDDEEDREKLFDMTIKGATTSTIIDIVSFLPYMDNIFQAGIAKSLDVIQDMLEVEDADKFPFYNPKDKSWVEGLGMLGITAQRTADLIDLIDVAYTRDYKDDFGKTKYITQEDADILKNFVLLNILSSVGIASPEIKTMTRRTLANVKRRSSTNKSGIKQERGSGSRGGGGGGGRTKTINKADLKKYFPELSKQIESATGEVDQEIKALEKEQREMKKRIKDQVYGD